jgi:hypothetical protein
MFNRAILLAGLVVLSAGAAQADTLWSQPSNHDGNAFSSQNDTNGFGNFATIYDNFTLLTAATVNGVTFDGEYFNPPEPGAITAFTVSIYDDNAGQPGAALSTQTIGGNANETFVGSFAGFPNFSYSLSLADVALGAGQYWVSFVPTLDFPPQWGNVAGSGGDGVSYQDFFGARSPLDSDVAFSIQGTSGAPEPAGWALMIGGFGLAGAALRRRRTAATA